MSPHEPCHVFGGVRSAATWSEALSLALLQAICCVWVTVQVLFADFGAVVSLLQFIRIARDADRAEPLRRHVGAG